MREELAFNEHDRWSRWMKYLFTRDVFNEDGSFTIDADSVSRWKRQMETSYDQLSEIEKDSDRKEADLTIGIFKKALLSGDIEIQ